MVTLKTNKGTTHRANYILSSNMNPDGVVISLDGDERKISKIAADFEGCAEIRAVNDNKPRVTELYDGYTELDGAQRLDSGSVRLTLSKPRKP